jgi:membrane protein DedA with SNARE-associated domain
MDLVAVLNHWGIALVFAAVLVDVGGLPLPAPPLLIVAGALSVDGSIRAGGADALDALAATP